MSDETASKASAKASAASVMARQMELGKELHDKLVLRLEEGASDSDDEEELSFDTSFESAADLPNPLPTDSVSTDAASQTVFFPIKGFIVPVHISYIREVAKEDGQEKSSELTVTFVDPGFSKQVWVPPQVLAHPDKVFVRKLTFVSDEDDGFDAVYENIKEMMRQFRDAQAELEEDVPEPMFTDEMHRAVTMTSDGAPAEEHGSVKVVRGRQLTMEPAVAGKPLTGQLVAYSTGLVFEGGFTVGNAVNEVTIVVPFTNLQLVFVGSRRNSHYIIQLRLRKPILIEYGPKDEKKSVTAHDIQFVLDNGHDNTPQFVGKTRFVDEQKRYDQLTDQMAAIKGTQLSMHAFGCCMEKLAKAATDEASFMINNCLSDGLVSSVNQRDILGSHANRTRQYALAGHCLVCCDVPFSVPLEEVDFVVLECDTPAFDAFDLTFVMPDMVLVKITAVPRANVELVRQWLTFDALDGRGVKFFSWHERVAWKKLQRMMGDADEYTDFLIVDNGWSRYFGEDPDDVTSDEEEDSGSEFGLSDDN